MFPSLSGIACKSLPNPHRVGICEGTFPKSPFYVWEQPRYVYLFSYHLPFWWSKIFHSWLWNNFTILTFINFVDEFVVDINFKLNNRKECTENLQDWNPCSMIGEPRIGDFMSIVGTFSWFIDSLLLFRLRRFCTIWFIFVYVFYY